MFQAICSGLAIFLLVLAGALYVEYGLSGSQQNGGNEPPAKNK